MSLSDLLGEAKKRRGLSELLDAAKRAREERKASEEHARVPIQMRKQSLVPEVVEEFVIRKDHQDKAVAKARELGVELVITRVDPWELYHTYPSYEQTGFAAIGARLEYERARERALQTLAARYVRATVRAPQPPERVVGVASSENGVVLFTVIPGEPDPWTIERMNGIDFGQCDQCGIRHRRVRIYLVMRPDGHIMQVGGTCADNLNLAKRLSNMVRAFNGFERWASSFGDDGDIDFWSSGGRATRLFDVPTALVLADRIIAEHGYMSRYRAETLGTSSTRDRLTELLFADPGSASHRVAKQILGESFRDGIALRDQALAWAQAEQARKDTSFIRNVISSLETGSPRLLGFLAYVPEGLRRAAERQAKQRARSRYEPWKPEIPFEVSTAARGEGVLKEYEYEPARVKVVIEVSPASRSGLAAVQGEGVFAPFVLECLAYMAQRSRAPVEVRLVQVHVARDFSEYPKQNQELYLERATVRAFAEAMNAATPTPVPTGADLLGLVQRDPKAIGLLEIPERVLTAARKDPAKRLTRTLSHKLGRYVPGLWTIESKRTVDTQFGSVHFLRLVRADGALIEWKASSVRVAELPQGYTGSGYLDQGDTIRILSASIGVAPPPHPVYGVQGRKVSRVKFVLARA